MADEIDQQREIEVRKRQREKEQALRNSKHHAPFRTEYRKDRNKTGGKEHEQDKSK